jgi:two-component system KDP operon response regulator KdpE
VSSPRANLLLIEDDPQIQRFLATALEAHGYALWAARTGKEGLQLATRQPDILIVDLGLPDMSGLEVIQRVREWFTRPIIVLSAREKETDKVAALDLGADDYLTKPFGIGELLARLRVAERHLAGRSGVAGDSEIHLGDITIDLAAHRVHRGDADIHLTPIEYQLLTTLARHRGKVLTHRQLLREVWGAAHVESPQYLRIYMRTLRRKIEADPARPTLLLTEIGVGYRLADEAVT